MVPFFVLCIMCIYILPPSQNISKKWLTKVNVFDAKFSSNILTFVDLFLLIFSDKGNMLIDKLFDRYLS
jgi:hypothetical protein